MLITDQDYLALKLSVQHKQPMLCQLLFAECDPALRADMAYHNQAAIFRDACGSGDLESAKLIYAHIADQAKQQVINGSAPLRGENPLQQACHGNHDEVVAWLFEQSADKAQLLTHSFDVLADIMRNANLHSYQLFMVALPTLKQDNTSLFSQEDIVQYLDEACQSNHFEFVQQCVTEPAFAHMGVDTKALILRRSCQRDALAMSQWLWQTLLDSPMRHALLNDMQQPLLFEVCHSTLQAHSCLATAQWLYTLYSKEQQQLLITKDQYALLQRCFDNGYRAAIATWLWQEVYNQTQQKVITAVIGNALLLQGFAILHDIGLMQLAYRAFQQLVSEQDIISHFVKCFTWKETDKYRWLWQQLSIELQQRIIEQHATELLQNACLDDHIQHLHFIFTHMNHRQQQQHCVACFNQLLDSIQHYGSIKTLKYLFLQAEPVTRQTFISNTNGSLIKRVSNFNRWATHQLARTSAMRHAQNGQCFLVGKPITAAIRQEDQSVRYSATACNNG